MGDMEKLCAKGNKETSANPAAVSWDVRSESIWGLRDRADVPLNGDRSRSVVPPPDLGCAHTRIQPQCHLRPTKALARLNVHVSSLSRTKCLRHSKRRMFFPKLASRLWARRFRGAGRLRSSRQLDAMRRYLMRCSAERHRRRSLMS